MIRTIPQIALDFLFKVEACRLVPYRDSKGVPTVGVGHTGPDVVMGQEITPAQASSYLIQDASTAGYKLAACVDREVIFSLDEHQYSALISFTFNVGAKQAWTIWADLNNHNLDAVPAQLMRFDKIRHDNGDVETLPGLEHRRAAECALWRQPDAIAAAAIALAAPVPPPPSSETRSADTPPTPLPPKPLANTSLATKVVGVVTAIGAGATQASAIVQPHADQVPVLAKMAMVLTCIVVGAGLVALLISHHQTTSATL